MTDAIADSPGAVDVLMIDDDPSVADSTAEILRLAGFTVVTATTMADADQAFKACEFRSIIVDHSLAEAQGCDSGTGERTRPPIIVMSGMGRDDLERLQRECGELLYACIAKPADPGHLIETIRSAIGS